jgi:hypothetical protein
MRTIVFTSATSPPDNYTSREVGVVMDEAVRGMAAALLEFIETYVRPGYTLEAMVRRESTPRSTAV